MIFPIPDPYRITTDFHEMRPLSRPPEKRNHPHGAIDIAVPTGTSIYAPERGEVEWHVQFRRGRAYHDVYRPYQGGPKYAFRNYFYETFGGLCVLYAHSGRTHVFAHIEAGEIFNRFAATGAEHFYTEDQNGDTSFYLFVNWRNLNDVHEGDFLCASGNAGYSTGAHVHYEIHKRKEWIPHSERLDPLSLYDL